MTTKGNSTTSTDGFEIGELDAIMLKEEEQHARQQPPKEPVRGRGRVVPAGAQDTDDAYATLRERFIYGKSQRFEHNEFADWVISEAGEHFASFVDTGDVLVYDGGIYRPHGDATIQKYVETVMSGTLSTAHNRSEVVGHVRVRSYRDRKEFDSDPDIINMNNGLYHISTGEFTAHTPQYKSLRKSAVNFDPSAVCPNIDQFIMESVPQENRQTIYEMAGYALQAFKNLKRGFIVLGKPDTGKSVLIKLLTAFVGEDATCAVGPVALGRDTHASQNMIGKMINVVDDLGATKIVETGNIKSVISSSPIEVNPKNKPSFMFSPQVLVVWGCNQIPKTEDMWVRDKFDVIAFKNRFGGHDRPDVKLINRITTDEELSGFFNKAIQAMSIAAERGGFSGSRDIVTRQKMWLHSSAPVSQFVAEKCDVENSEALYLTDSFYKAYFGWVRKHDLTSEKKKEVVEYLESIGVFKTKMWKRENTDYGRMCFKGICPQTHARDGTL